MYKARGTKPTDVVLWPPRPPDYGGKTAYKYQGVCIPSMTLPAKDEVGNQESRLLPFVATLASEAAKVPVKG